MRIISGRFKGQLLVNFQAKHIRPTTDRIKGSLFNKWMNEVDGSRVLDLFAGTGNLGLEALSRGAVHCTFVEGHETSVRIIRDNIQKLKVASSEYRIVKQDVLDFLKRYHGDPFDLILIDPPFTEKMAEEVMKPLSRSKAFGPQTLIAIESGTKEPIADQYRKLVCYDRRDFGDKTLSLFQESQQVEDTSGGPIETE